MGDETGSEQFDFSRFLALFEFHATARYFLEFVAAGRQKLFTFLTHGHD